MSCHLFVYEPMAWLIRNPYTWVLLYALNENLPLFNINLQVLAVTEGYTVNKTLSSIIEDLENVTAAYKAPRSGEDSRSMYEKDLVASVDALTRMIKYNAENKTRPLSNNHDIKNLVKISSNLLELSNLPAWKTALKVIIRRYLVTYWSATSCRRTEPSQRRICKQEFLLCGIKIKKAQSREL